MELIQITDNVSCYRGKNSRENIYRIQGHETTVLFDAGQVHASFIHGADMLVINDCSPLRMQSLKRILIIEPEITLVGTASVLNFTEEFLGQSFKKIVVRKTRVLELGGIAIKLIPVPNVSRSRHQDRTWRKAYKFLQMPNWQWIDSICGFIPEEKILLSGQCFSAESGSRYRYFCENLRPYEKNLLKHISMLESLEAAWICPEQGDAVPAQQAIDEYKQWMAGSIASENKKRISIIYTSAFGYTEQMAGAFAEGARQIAGIDVDLFSAEAASVEEQMDRLYRSDGIVFGAPTVEGGAARCLRRLAAEMTPARFKGKFGTAFGSYSYQPGGVADILSSMKQLDMEVADDGISIRFRPETDQLEELKAFGKHFATCVKNKETIPFEIHGRPDELRVEDTDRRFLIIGNGAAGTTAAEEIRKRDGTCSIEIISEEESSGYNRQMLTKGIMGEIPEQNLLLHKDGWYEEKKISVTLGRKVIFIDADNKKVTLSDESEKTYDRLIVATGASALFPNVPGFDKEGIFSVHDRKSTDTMRKYVEGRKVKQVVILGGGILGMETAAELSAYGLELTIIERASHLMAKQLNEKSGELVAKQLEKCGVHVITSEKAEELLGEKEISGVRLSSGRCCPAQLVISCLGIEENSALLQETGGGIPVNEKMETDKKDVYACGDCVAFRGVNYGLWEQAVEMARVAAANAAGSEDKVYKGVIPAVTYAGFGMSIFVVGENGNAMEKCYESKELYEPGEGVYKKLYFKNRIFSGGILLGHVDEAAELIQAYQNKKRMDELKL